MKKSLLLLSLILSSQHNKAEHKGQPVQSGLLWEVTGNGLTKPSYLLGTFHLANVSWLDSIPGAQEKFVFSDILITEIKPDTNGVLIPDLRGIYMKDTSLRDLLTPQEYERLSYLIRNLVGIEPAALNNIRPGFVMAYLIEAMMMKINGEEGFVEKMDLGLMKSAREMHKQQEGLETMEFQVEVLKNLGSLQRQAEQLAEFISDTTRAKNELSHLYSAYKKGDLTALYAMSRESTTGMNEAEMKLLLTDRNETWLKQLPQYFKSGSCFVAIGALHLAGPQGLIERLKQMGYTVKPVPGNH
jgi:uncharacterized protein